MDNNRFFIISALAAALALAQTQQDIDNYPDWAQTMVKEGYSWEPHTTKTADGWTLTLFRLTGKIVDGEKKSLVTHDVPVLVQHGFGMDALMWAQWNVGDTVWPL